MTNKNKSKRNKGQDYFPSLYIMQDDYPVNKYDGLSMPTQNISQIATRNTGNTSSPQLTGLQPDSYQAAAKYGTTPQLNKESLGSSFSENFKNMFSTEGLNVLGNAAASVGAGALGTLGGNLISGGKSSGVGNAIGDVGGAIGGAAMMVNPVLGGAVMLGSKLIGGGINALFGSKMNYENINRIENELNQSRNYNSSATNFDELTQEIMSAPSIGYFSKSDIGSDGLFSNKASRKFRELSARKKFVEDWITRSQANSATNLQQNQLNDQLMGWFAYGGPLDYNYGFGGGAIGYDLANKQLGIESMKAMGQNRQYSLPNLGLNTFAEGGGDLNGNNSNNSNSGLLSKTQELLDNIGYGNTPLSTIVPEEYKNIADGIWGGLEMFTPLGTIMGAADVANDIRNIYHKGNISSSDLGNLMLDSSGFIPGGKVLKKAAKSLSKVLPKKAEKLYTFADNLTYTTPKGIKEVKKRVADAKDFSKKAEKAAMNALIIKNRNEALDAAMKIREASRFNQGILSGVDKALDSNAIQYNTTKNILQKADAINDTFGIMGNVENELNKKSFGGDLLTNGTVFSNNVIEVNNGGTHEESPYEGVQMGIDSQGIPNLVEEGELIWNDYVFSNRIPVPDAVRNKYKLRGTKDMTFSDAAKKIQKASEERPNDPIANDTLNINLTRLANEQEIMREQKKNKRHGKQYATGGDLDFLLDAYNEAITSPYSQATTGFGEGLDVNPNLAAKREKDILTTKAAKKRTQLDENISGGDNLLRYAPAFGSALGVGYGLLSKPNYSRADALAQFAQNAGKVTPISYDPLGDFLTYRPTDMNHIANRMAAQAGATRRNIMNTSGGNRANAIGSLLAADYNSQIAQADAIRQGEDTNWNRYMQAMTFNRGTKQYNSETALKAAVANQEARMKASQLGLSGYTNAMQMKDAIDAQRAKTLSANLTNLFESLGQIGEEQYDKNRLKWLERKGVLRSDYFDTDKYSRNSKKTKG